MSDQDSKAVDLSATQNALLSQFAGPISTNSAEQRWRWFWRVVWLFVAASMVWPRLKACHRQLRP